jgi:hemerythrin
MTALLWTDALALQQPRLDDTHREFVACLNTLALAQGETEQRAALRAFAEHTEAHFAQEEAWMRQLGLDPVTCHGAQHRQVLDVVHEVQRRVAADAAELALIASLVPALAEWFPVHAQTMDAGLAVLMAERGFDPDTGAAVGPAADGVSAPA